MNKISTDEVHALMKRCQTGVANRYQTSMDEAHDIMAECYGTLGALVQERDALTRQLEVLTRHYNVTQN